MHLTNDQIQDVLGVLAGILHLGNVSFVQAGGAQVADKAGTVSELMIMASHQTYFPSNFRSNHIWSDKFTIHCQWGSQ